MAEHITRSQGDAVQVIRAIIDDQASESREETRRGVREIELRQDIEDLMRAKGIHKDPDTGASLPYAITPPVTIDEGQGEREIWVQEVLMGGLVHEIEDPEGHRLYMGIPKEKREKASAIYYIPRVGRPIGRTGQTLGAAEMENAITLVHHIDNVLP